MPEQSGRSLGRRLEEEQRQTKHRTGRSTNRLGSVGVRGGSDDHPPGDAGRGGGAEHRPHVPGILNAVEHDEQRAAIAKDGRRGLGGPPGDAEHALGSFHLRQGFEDVRGHQDQPDAHGLQPLTQLPRARVRGGRGGVDDEMELRPIRDRGLEHPPPLHDAARGAAL